jgi:hypothetical protein
VAGVYTRGAIADWRSVIDHAQVHVPADLIAPGWLTVTDTDDLCAVLAPRPLAILQPLDGRNRAVGSERLAKLLTLTQAAYRSAKTAGGDSNSSSSAAPVSDDTSSGKEKSNSLQLTEIDIADWVKQILPSLQTPDKERKTEVSQ